MLETVQSGRDILRDCETVIEQAQATFRLVGDALNTINVDQLWKLDGYSDFDEYCQNRWGFKKRHGYELIAAAKVLNQLEETFQIEAQSQPLFSPVERELISAPEELSEPALPECAIAHSEPETPEQNPQSAPAPKPKQSKAAPKLPTAETHARELGKLPKSLQADAWRRIVETAPNGKVTAAHVKAVVGDIKSEQTGHVERRMVDDQAVKDAGLRFAFSAALDHHQSHMLMLKPESLARVWGQDDRRAARRYFTWVREWIASVEAALETPALRRVGGEP